MTDLGAQIPDEMMQCAHVMCTCRAAFESDYCDPTCSGVPGEPAVCVCPHPECLGHAEPIT